MSGRLYVVATPIGNLEDMTFRAVRILGEVDLVAVENTGRALKLLSHYGISVPLALYGRDRNRRQAGVILEKLSGGSDVALITNAGTPGLSDPGSALVRAALERGCAVVPVPGPSALAAAVSVSGMPSAGLVFLGHLSPKRGKRRKQLERFAGEDLTVVVYESPHRLRDTLEDIILVMGDRSVVVAREMTKKFEEVRRAPAGVLLDVFSRREPRGEFTLLIRGGREGAEDE